MKEIVNQLNQWMEERHLTKDAQRKGFTSNIQEEIMEYYDATDDNERIDAVCDMTVFTINAMNDSDKELLPELSDENYLLPYFKETSHFGIGVDNIKASNFAFEQCKDMLRICYTASKNLGYDFKKAMLETIKEISSRTGSFDPAKNKWIKDTSDEAKAKWYKADYEKARLCQ